MPRSIRFIPEGGALVEVTDRTVQARLLPDLQTLAAEQGSTLDRLRLNWVAGRIAAGLGDHDHARHLLAGVRQTFLAADNAYEAALATLDLVIPDLKEGKTAEVLATSAFRGHQGLKWQAWVTHPPSSARPGMPAV